MWFRQPSAHLDDRLDSAVRLALEHLEQRDVPAVTFPVINTIQLPPTATVGSLIADEAIVSNAFNPTGTVTFNLYNNPNGTGTALYTDTEALVNGIAISGGYTATTTGTDYWVATYNGDDNNSGATSGTADEPVIVTPASPSITTTQLPANATVGTSIADQATVSGGFNPTGTVTFNLYNNPNGTGTALFTDTEALVGGVATSKGFTATTAGTDYWVATYNGDANNSSVTSGTADEPVTITSGTPKLEVTKTADQPTVTAGQTVGFTVTITNTGTATATGLTLSDPLPAGMAGDINYTIDTTVGNPTDFTITGPVGNQNLSLSPTFMSGGDSLAAGQTISVHITGLTSTFDATGTSTSPNPSTGISASGSNAYLGLAGDYAVLYEGTGGHNLQITNVTVDGNIGVGGTAHVQYNGPGTIGGEVDFSAGNSGQYANNNGANVGPTSVNYNAAQVTAALNTVNTLNSSLKGLGTNITLNGNQTINESAGQLDVVNDVAYRVFNVTSYNEGNGNLLTVNGDGSGDPVVFNFGANSNVNLGGDVNLTGGLTADQVLWNFTSSGQHIQLNNNASSYGTVAFQGVILAPNDAISIVNSNLIGRVFGGDSQDMQIVSGDTITAPTTTGLLPNAATVNGITASASVTITTPPVGGPLAQGETATIGFWHNKNGQALIDSFNGGPNATNLGNWLATNFSNLYGSSAGANNLTGATNAQVATYFLTLFNQSGQKTGAQILAAALAVYATDSSLAGGTMAAKYGFIVSTSGSGTGTGIATYNVGTSLASFGGPTGQVSIFQLLQFVNSESKNGLIGSLTPNLYNVFNTIFSGINQKGDIT